MDLLPARVEIVTDHATGLFPSVPAGNTYSFFLGHRGGGKDEPLDGGAPSP